MGGPDLPRLPAARDRRREAFRPYRTGFAILCGVLAALTATGFGWRDPPYEYEEHELPIHLLLGCRTLREAIEAGADPRRAGARLGGDLERWNEERSPMPHCTDRRLPVAGSGHIHFIGVCGTAMAAVAAELHARGVAVTGSDRAVYPPMSTFLSSAA